LWPNRVEGLEHHPDIGPQRGQGASLFRQRLAVEGDGVGVDGLEPVDAPAQRGLAGARGPDHHHNLAPGDGKIDVIECRERPEGLDDLVDHDQRRGTRHQL
jgi:hypothetical protein